MRRDLRGLIPPQPEDYTKEGASAISELPLPPGLIKKIKKEKGDDTKPQDLTAAIIHLSFPLECVTPVVGGGVEKQLPDTTEPLRIPSIRGQLRMWWRAFQPEPSNADELFRNESALWGGVGVNSDGNAENDTRRSRVVLRIRDAKYRADLPAGRHEGGRSLPKWDGGRPMGYGLFPLQLPRGTLNRLTGDPPTASVRHGLTFVLEVTVFLKDNLEKAKSDLQEVLGSLWAWIHLGGIGARTTRGFGALCLALAPSGIAKNAAIESRPSSCLAPEDARKAFRSELEGLLKHFEPPAEDGIGEWIKGAQKAFGPRHQPTTRASYHPRLPDKGCFIGPPKHNAREAHSEGLAMLMDFRQQPGIGRDPGQQGGRPGRSRWPEADTMRRLAAKNRGVSFRKHGPKDPTNPGANCAPRAAFGMPLHIAFKDLDDEPASGAIVPQYGNRWTSPLRIRPLRCADGRFVCLMIYLDQPLPPDQKDESKPGTKVAAVLAQQKRFPVETEDKVPVLAEKGEGAKDPIAKHLKHADGDAILALFNRLTPTPGRKGAS